MYNYKDLYIIDFTKVKYYLEMHEVIRKALDFPDYYGCNWDAFWDCLTDMYGEPINIRIIGIEVIERKFDNAAEKMLEILKEFKCEEDEFCPGRVKIEILMEDGSVTTID